MRVAFVTRLYHPSVGGQETRFRALAESLAGRGHHVDVLCIGHDQSLPSREVLAGVTVHRLVHTTLFDRLLAGRVAKVLGRLVRALVVFAPYAVRTRRHLRRGDYDLVYFNQDPLVHVVAAPASVRRRSGIDWCEVRAEGHYRWGQRHLPSMVAVNFAITRDGCAELARQSGVEPDYLPSGVHAHRYASRPRGQRRGVLFVGRLYPNKNVPLLVEGWAAFRDEGGTEPLVIVGDGPERAAVEAAVERLPAAQRGEVMLAGAVDEERKIELLSSSLVLAITSRNEGFPNTVAESAASRLPVFTVDEPLNGTAGVVRELGLGVVGAPTPAGVASGLREILDRWDDCAAAAETAAGSLAWPRIVDRFLAVFAAAGVGESGGQDLSSSASSSS